MPAGHCCPPEDTGDLFSGRGRKWKEKWQNSCQNTVIFAKKSPLRQKGAETTKYSALP
jgi:hypothetical protein